MIYMRMDLHFGPVDLRDMFAKSWKISPENVQVTCDKVTVGYGPNEQEVYEPHITVHLKHQIQGTESLNDVLHYPEGVRGTKM